VRAFSPVSLAHLAANHAEEAVDSISVAAELALGELGEGGEAGPVRHAQRRERLLAAIRAERARQERRLAALREQGAKAAEAERLREQGELIYAYLWQIRPGQTALEVDGTSVPLDPELDGKGNAQAYFERYRKARDAAAHLPDLEAGGEAQLAELDQLLTLTEQAAGFAELETLQAEWEARGGPPRDGAKPRRRTPDRRPRPLHDAAGNAVYIGRSGAQNDLVTFDLAGPNDTWLHARGVPGSHVVVRWRGPGDDEEPATIEAAAALAAFYSAARNAATVEVDATRRRHVRKIKGAGPGMVTYRNERTLAVRPADEADVAPVLRADRPS
jgi:predicted ribosome quality control (RQC) complex YloA/Tae2 family protein